MTTFNIKTDFGAIGNGIADDAPAFVAAGNALNGTSGNTLQIPAGTYSFLSNAGSGGRFIGQWTAGIVQFTCVGAGAASTTIDMSGFCNQLGGHGQAQDGNHYGRIASVSAGSSTATLLNPSDSSLFSVNQWVLISGLNIQDGYSVIPNGFGYPANLEIFEYIQISAINAGTGVLTFTTPLVQSYLSTWPIINIGDNFEVNAGGSAGIYSLPSDWDTTVEYQNLTIVNTVFPQIYANGRNITYRNCIFGGGCGAIPTQNQSWSAINCTASGVDMEVDKLITNMLMDGCTWGRPTFQSASVTNCTLNNCTFTNGINGTGITSTVTGCTLGGYMQAGSFAYGVCSTLDISNCSIPEWRFGGNLANGVNGSGTSNCTRMSGGVIICPNGVSQWTNAVDNGSGKTRCTVDNTGGMYAGQIVPISNAFQQITTTTTVSSGNTLTFSSVPAWIVNGVTLLGQSNGVNGIPDNTTVVSSTATTVTLSASITATINSGSGIIFSSSAYAGKTTTVLSVINGTTVDIDINFPTSFGFSFGQGMGGQAQGWAVPGKTVFFNGTEMGSAQQFKILGITQDANSTYVQTDQAGGFPLVPSSGSGIVNINTTGVQRIRASNLTGASPYNAQLMLPQNFNKPLGTYFTQTHTADQTTSDNVITFGNFVSVIINVTKPYTGTQPSLYVHLNQFDNFLFNVDGVGTRFGWGVNAKVAGKRIILPTNISSNPTAQSGDGSLTVPSWSRILWMNTTWGYILTNSSVAGTQIDISGENPSVWPSVTIEVQADQGIPDLSATFGLLSLRR